VVALDSEVRVANVQIVAIVEILYGVGALAMLFISCFKEFILIVFADWPELATRLKDCDAEVLQRR